MAAWAGAVFVWRRLVMLEIKAREQQLLTAAQAAAASAEQACSSSGRQGGGGLLGRRRPAMDPIHPITPGPPPISRVRPLPVERLERITRERDRPTARRRGAPPPRASAGGCAQDGPRDEDGPAHIDVRA